MTSVNITAALAISPADRSTIFFGCLMEIVTKFSATPWTDTIKLKIHFLQIALLSARCIFVGEFWKILLSELVCYLPGDREIWEPNSDFIYVTGEIQEAFIISYLFTFLVVRDARIVQRVFGGSQRNGEPHGH